eukprot:Em0021g268a
MGSCISTALPSNVFKVTPINDDRRNVQKGILIVTKSDIRYIDSHTEEQLEWPLKYIRNWAYDKHMFSFEAGKKCLGGEGLYAFTTDRAQQLYELVSENLNLPREVTLSSHHRPPSETTQLPPNPVLPARPNAIVTPTTEPTSPPPLPNPRIVPITPYQVLEFDKEPKLYPAPPPATHPVSNYTSIDFSETEQLSIRRKNGTVNVPITTLDTKRHTQSVSHTSDPRKSSRSSLDSPGSMTEGRPGSLTTPNSGTFLPGAQNYQNITFNRQATDRPQSNCEGGGAVEHHNYSNVSVGSEVPTAAAGSTPQDGGQNISSKSSLEHPATQGNNMSTTSLTNKATGRGLYSSKTASQEILTPGVASAPEDGHNSYANITLGSASRKGNEPYTFTTPLTHKASAHGSTKTTGQEVPTTTQVLTSTPQDGHGSYANLLLGPTTPKGSELTPQSHKMSVSVHGSGNYPELDLSASIPTTSPLRGSGVNQTTPTPEASKTGAHVEAGKAAVEGAAGEGVAAAVDRLRDTTKVNYGVLDFSAMKGLEKMQKERELLKQEGGEPMSREERTNSVQSNKKQK